MKHGGIVHRMHEWFHPIAAFIPGVWAWKLFLATRPRTVVCQNCKDSFQSVLGLDGKGTQGVNCAASSNAKNKTITGHYGSKFDMQLFSFNDCAFDADPICDNCIEHFITSGIISLHCFNIAACGKECQCFINEEKSQKSI